MSVAVQNIDWNVPRIPKVEGKIVAELTVVFIILGALEIKL